MSYIINKTDGTTLVTLDPGILDQSTSLYLIGKNYPNYGELQQENFVRLLENFANATEPNAPLVGQLWYDTDAKKIKYYDGTRFKAPGPTVQPTKPNEPEVGDQWWDTTNDQMFLYDGANWLLVGPLYSKLDAKSGPFVEKLFNVDRFPKRVVSTWLENSRQSILSSANFISNVILPGFPTISKGYNFQVDSTHPMAVAFDAGNVAVINNNINANLTLQSNVAGTITTTLTVNGATGEITIAADPTSNLAIATKQYVDNTIYNVVNDPDSAMQVRLGGIDANLVSLISNAASQQNALSNFANTKADVVNPQFLGVPTAATAEITDNSTQIATTAFVKSALVVSDSAKWQGSSKYISSTLPTNADGIDGDFWFQI
jgi:hypothetical protein